MCRHLASLSLALLLTAAAADALARSEDRNQPLELDAETTDGFLTDDGQTTFSGNVVATQGTLHIRADQAVVTMRNGDIVRVVLTGNPARMRQEDDQGQPMDARARRVDYDLSTDQIVFTGGVEIEQPRGSLRGERVFYDMATSRVNAGQSGERVRMVIQPRTAQGN
ncbi:lipopolysaccharide transport periplasmic protein LptA [Coralloluteibacterium thermophilus]|uniref:Lipopolysaccharide export system protein LptA n=1 Tax=Coralloluteibacterium thermophilum TaxID=2707049 RepID=A0ABV9NHI5_9GAMM